ncbi:MAG: hypothetical protein CM15mP71_3230 [Candidatus Poseidoniales archaeon]|nr:MAG: hypothetical protein CM15mP71_3230 [Candidatus Poseidoniales archaeon]
MFREPQHFQNKKGIVINLPTILPAVYLPSEIEELTSIAAENDLWIFDDMIYSDLVYSDHSYIPLPPSPRGKKENSNHWGWSKIWAMTGLGAWLDCRS